MITGNEVFQLASDKGYNLRYSLTDIDQYVAENDKVDYYLFELSLIQKWLRDEHKIDTNPITCWTLNQPGLWYFPNCSTNGENISTGFQAMKYEQALLEGISEALKLIQS